MDYKLKDKRAIVTGSSKGIGKATAKLLAEEGASVILHGRSEESLAGAMTEIPGAQGVVGDLSSEAGVDAVISQLNALGPVDILVNNAGIFEAKDVFDAPYDDWMRLFQTNVMSGVWLARALMPAMLDRNWGRVIFLSSESGIHIPIEMVHYGMTKTAQLAVSRGLAERTKGTSVTVNSVLPGPTMSDGVGHFVSGFVENAGVDRETFERETFFDEVRPTSLIRRFADPEEVAQMIVYLCSPLASATNGSALRVDGGVVKSPF